MLANAIPRSVTLLSSTAARHATALMRAGVTQSVSSCSHCAVRVRDAACSSSQQQRTAPALQGQSVHGVCVVVSRWFGGVYLRPSRFTIITNVAHQLLDQQGFMAKAARAPAPARTGLSSAAVERTSAPAEAASLPSGAAPAAMVVAAGGSAATVALKASAAPDSKAGAAADPAAGKAPAKKRNKGKAALNLPADELRAVFSHIAGGKVTIGSDEFMYVVMQLDLDVGDDMVEAGWELVEGSGLAGPCNRMDEQQFVGFMEHIATL
jgi:Uncharacterized protein family UPF0029